MTAHQHHTHPENDEPYCCCGYGYPDLARTGESVDGLPTWAEVWKTRDPSPRPWDVEPAWNVPAGWTIETESRL